MSKKTSQKYYFDDEIKLSIDNYEVLLIKKDTTYEFSFSKSLSNVKTSGDMLPLVIPIKNHVSSSYEFIEDSVVLKYQLTKHQLPFKNINNLLTYEKLHLLRNVSEIFSNASIGYTYFLNPHNLVYDDNLIPYTIYIGYHNLLEPLNQDEDKLLRQYKCLIISIFDTKYDFDALYNGTLESCKKTTLMNKIFKAENVNEVALLLDDAYLNEMKKNQNSNISVNKNKNFILKLFSFLSIIVALFLIILSSNAYLKTIPYQNKMNEVSTSFVSNDYGNVISLLRKDKVEKLPTAQQFMLAYAYIQAEPLNEDSKVSALNAISVKSDARFLAFWTYMGREDYEKALSIAKELTDYNLQYHATFRAITIITKDTKMSGSDKEAALKKYNDQLVSLEEILFPKEEE